MLVETSGAFSRWIHKAFNYFSVLLIVFTGNLFEKTKKFRTVCSREMEKFFATRHTDSLIIVGGLFSALFEV